MKRLGLIVLVLALLRAVVTADEVVLTATDSKSIDPGGANWNDNRLRAYWSNRYVDGFVKFDFSAIPDGANITAMTLTTYHEEGFGNPRNDPEVKIYRVSDDSWSRGPTDPHPGFAEVLTDIHTGFPSGNLEPYDWKLDVDAVDWQDDMDDDVLSLAMREEKLSYSYVYWHGSNQNPKPPILTVTFGEGGGNCYYKLKKVKAKKCDSCPAKGSDFVTEAKCEKVGDCKKKIKTTISCPEEGNKCKLKGKRSSCG